MSKIKISQKDYKAGWRWYVITRSNNIASRHRTYKAANRAIKSYHKTVMNVADYN